MDCKNFELLMMTSATLIEALYEAVSDWLSENANGKTNIMELSSADPWHIYSILKLFTHQKLQPSNRWKGYIYFENKNMFSFGLSKLT